MTSCSLWKTWLSKLQNSSMTQRNVKFSGQGSHFPCLKISLYFADEKLQRVTLSRGDSLSLLIFGSHPQEEDVIQWFRSLFQGKQLPFPLPLEINHLGAFTRNVLAKLQKIPFATTQSYSDVAASLDNKNSSRAVGNACRVNPFPLIIPCHRVIHKGGSIGGFAYGTSMKEELIEFEKEI